MLFFLFFCHQSAASCYIELIVKESDNNVKLIVLDRLIALKENPSHEKVLRVSGNPPWIRKRFSSCELLRYSDSPPLPQNCIYIDYIVCSISFVQLSSNT